MIHTILVGAGYGEKSLEDAIAGSAAGDVIVIKPGIYHTESYWSIASLVIRGTGESSGEVVIHTSITVKEQGTLTLQNLTMINDFSKRNAVDVKKAAHVVADRVAFLNNVEHDYPTVFVNGGIGEFSACEMNHANVDGAGLYAKDGAQISLSQCDVQSPRFFGSQIQSETSQFRLFLGVGSKSNLVADTLYFAGEHKGWWTFNISNGSSLQADGLVLPEGKRTARVADSQATIGQTNIDATHQLKLTTEGVADTNIPGITLRQKRKKANPDSSTKDDKDQMEYIYTVGTGYGKCTLDEALENANSGDVILIEPGEYRSENNWTVASLEFRGAGGTPEAAVIHAHLVADGGTLKLNNLTLINDDSDWNALKVGATEQVIADNVVFVNNANADYPTVALNGGTGEFSACEIKHANAADGGLYAHDGAKVSLSQCTVEGVFCVGSTINSSSSRLGAILTVQDNGQVLADTLYFSERYSDWWTLHILNNSVVQADGLVLPEGELSGNITDSRVTIKETNIDQAHALELVVEGDAEANIPGARLRQTASNVEPQAPAKDDKNPDLEVTPTTSDEPTETEQKSAIDQLDEMIGLAELKKQVHSFVKVASFNQRRAEQGMKTSGQSLHSLFLGNPGTGKTTVARLVGRVMFENGVLPDNTYVEVSRQDLVSDNVGGTALKTQKVLESALGGVLFIDEAYELYQKGGVTNWGQEAVDTILKYMEDHRNDLMIIFAGYTKEMQDFMNMNPGLTSRTPNVFNFSDYTPDEIAEIGIGDLHRQDYQFDEAYYTKVVKREFVGDVDHSNGRWVRNFNEKLIRIFAKNLPEDATGDQLGKISNADIDELTGGDQSAKNSEVDALLAQLNGMIGLQSVKQFVNDLVTRIRLQQKLHDVLQDNSKPTYHMIFTGAPGTGKTTVARLIAKLFFNLGILPKDTVSEVSRPDLVGRYIGETEEKTATVIRNAMGGVLFVDEAYQLTKAGSSNDFGKEAVETFVTELENNRDKFVAIFAGYTDDMKDFLVANEGLRSRIPLTLEFEDYTPEEVAEIVTKIVTKSWTVNEQLLQSVVVDQYKALPKSERSNGRWARNFADTLISQHKLWLADHLEEDPDLDVKRIQDSELTANEANQDDKDQAVDDLLAELNGMIGLNSVKTFVTDLVAKVRVEKKLKEKLPDSNKPTYHMVFSGAPGTGKTTVARIISKLFYNLGILPTDRVMEVSRPDLVGQYIGETEAKTSKVLRNAMGGVLFVDEAYQLTQSGGSNDFGKEAVETFITALENDRDQFVTIFAGYTDDMKDFLAANEGLRSRIPLTLEFEDYTPEEVAEIVTKIVTKSWTVNEQLLQSVVVDQYKALPKSERSNGRWARNFADTLISQHKLWLVDHLEEDPDLDVKRIQDSELTANEANQDDKDQAVDDLLAELNGMIGLNSVKTFVTDLVAKVRVEKKLKEKLPDSNKPTYHMVFSGAPGTGKTTVARIISKLFYNLGILPTDRVMEVSRPDLVGQYIGETEAKTSKVLRNAMGGVLFVDEAYQLTKAGDSKDFGKEAVETFITALENDRDQFVAIFAGYTDDMDKFLAANEGLRSRVPLKLEFENYTPEEVAQIVTNIVTKNWTVNVVLLKSVVASLYKKLPENERSNGRWARNFAEKLISQHKLWLGKQDVELAGFDVKKIQDDLLLESVTW
ncbi:AAA family ATPase [Lacticaseibacillus sp. GG6-2]